MGQLKNVRKSRADLRFSLRSWEILGGISDDPIGRRFVNTKTSAFGFGVGSFLGQFF
jgi:hypothetical protein